VVVCTGPDFQERKNAEEKSGIFLLFSLTFAPKTCTEKPGLFQWSRFGRACSQVAGKGLGLLHELIPRAPVVALLANPKLPETVYAQEAARLLKRQLIAIDASTPSEIDSAFATMRQRRISALLLGVIHSLAAVGSNRCPRGARRDPCRVRQPRIHCGGWTNELWQ
jgi:hypothetical protein